MSSSLKNRKKIQSLFEENGFELVRITKHSYLYEKQGRRIAVSKTTSDHRAFTKARSELKRALKEIENNYSDKDTKDEMGSIPSEYEDVDKQKCANRMMHIVKETNGLSFAECARRTKISKSVFFHWRKGQSLVQRRTIKKFCDYFNVRESWLLFGQGPVYRIDNNKPPESKPKQESHSKIPESSILDPGKLLVEALTKLNEVSSILKQLSQCDLMSKKNASEILLEAAAIMAEQESHN